MKRVREGVRRSCRACQELRHWSSGPCSWFCIEPITPSANLRILVILKDRSVKAASRYSGQSRESDPYAALENAGGGTHELSRVCWRSFGMIHVTARSRTAEAPGVARAAFALVRQDVRIGAGGPSSGGLLGPHRRALSRPGNTVRRMSSAASGARSERDDNVRESDRPRSLHPGHPVYLSRLRSPQFARLADR